MTIAREKLEVAIKQMELEYPLSKTEKEVAVLYPIYHREYGSDKMRYCRDYYEALDWIDGNGSSRAERFDRWLLLKDELEQLRKRFVDENMAQPPDYDRSKLVKGTSTIQEERLTILAECEAIINKINEPLCD